MSEMTPTARELLDSYRLRNMGQRDHSTTTYTAEHLAARVEAVLALLPSWRGGYCEDLAVRVQGILEGEVAAGCLCSVGWRHCPIHQDDGRGEAMSETPQEVLEQWLAHPYGRFRVEVREAIRAVLEDLRLRDIDCGCNVRVKQAQAEVIALRAEVERLTATRRDRLQVDINAYEQRAAQMAKPVELRTDKAEEALRKAAWTLRNGSYAHRVDAALSVIDEALGEAGR